MGVSYVGISSWIVVKNSWIDINSKVEFVNKYSFVSDQTTEVNLELLTRIPGVLKIDPKIPDADNIWATLKSATEQALNGLISMRETEGNHLLQDLTDRINTMRESLSQIQSKASELPAKHRQVLMDRLQQAGLEQIDLNDERILKELVLFADKSDISEEITRLESHFEHFNTLCANQKQVGRSLDFLAQEMFREINTIGSKASNHEIAHVVVSLKTELEKFREQVQNLEWGAVPSPKLQELPSCYWSPHRQGQAKRRFAKTWWKLSHRYIESSLARLVLLGAMKSTVLITIFWTNLTLNWE